MKNILELLERAVEASPDKLAFADERKALSYQQLFDTSRRIGTALSRHLGGKTGQPVALCLPRGVDCICAMLGVVYSGNWYVVLDCDSPTARLRCILDALQPAISVAQDGSALSPACLPLAALSQTPPDAALLSNIRARMIDTDPLYALFTSGSTGTPKGAIISHRNVLSYLAWFTRCFSIDAQTVFGSQTPLYFSMSVSDVFATLSAGATLHLIPKRLFSFPMQLLEFMKERRVNTIYWVPSALGIVSRWRALDYCPLPHLRKVLFAGEVMPVKHLNYWMEQLPDALFANLFGPTETTDICTYYIVDRRFSDHETLPIGNACDNCEVFAVNEAGQRCAEGEVGELYVRGSFLSAGYFGDAEKTAGAFVQNPFQSRYPEPVYKTGDLVRLNARGEYEFLCRKDAQIKHAGYRIELGEIEAAAGAMAGIDECAVLYDADTDRLVLLFTGRGVTERQAAEWMRARVPAYMLPSVCLRLNAMPCNRNGKIDRRYLMTYYRAHANQTKQTAV